MVKLDNEMSQVSVKLFEVEELLKTKEAEHQQTEEKLVEAKENSGSLITVNYALEQGKEVFAVPGNITSINSKGTNNIIFEGARIFRDVEDIFNS